MNKVEQSKIIKMIMGFKGVKGSELAKTLNKSPSNLFQIFSRDNFRTQELEEIANALNCDIKITWIDRETGKEFL